MFATCLAAGALGFVPLMTHYDCGCECLKRTDPLWSWIRSLLGNRARPGVSGPLEIISENSWSYCQLIQSHLALTSVPRGIRHRSTEYATDVTNRSSHRVTASDLIMRPTLRREVQLAAKRVWLLRLEDLVGSRVYGEFVYPRLWSWHARSHARSSGSWHSFELG